MSPSAPPRPRPRIATSTKRLGTAMIIAALAGVVVPQVLASSPPSAASPTATVAAFAAGPPPSPSEVVLAEVAEPLGEPPPRGADGGGVLDEDEPTVANLRPELLDALRGAAAAAAEDGVEIGVNSGWRSAEHQEELLREAVERYGSHEEAARWVAIPESSLHVSGDAVDLGPPEATDWLSDHGAEHGLCQVYDNEPWHYELRPDAATEGCPPRYEDPTHDPRMQR